METEKIILIIDKGGHCEQLKTKYAAVLQAQVWDSEFPRLAPHRAILVTAYETIYPAPTPSETEETQNKT